MKLVKIYGLFHPVSAECFYVGATTLELKIRLSYHVCKHFDKWRLSPIVQTRIDLIRNIQKIKMKPISIMLAEVEQPLVDHCEKFYYRAIINLGYDLLQDKKKFCYTSQHTTEAILQRTSRKNGGKRYEPK